MDRGIRRLSGLSMWRTSGLIYVEVESIEVCGGSVD